MSTKTTEIICWVDSKFVPHEDAVISLFDRGFLYGHALFETMRAYKGFVLHMERHLDRLRNAILFLGLASSQWVESSNSRASRCSL